MADIFISYASDDRSRVEPLAKALGEQGWSVWWDKTIPPGKTFDQVIEEAIDAASCVIVLWSEKSIKSDWVKEEANIGKERKILVPVKIDPVDLPIGFSRIQAADLTNWESDRNHPGFLSLRNAISDLFGPPLPQKKSEQGFEVGESNVEQTIDVQPNEKETPQPIPRQNEPTSPRTSKTSNALKIGAVAVLIILLMISGWYFYIDRKGQHSSARKTVIEDATFDKSQFGEAKFK